MCEFILVFVGFWDVCVFKMSTNNCMTLLILFSFMAIFIGILLDSASFFHNTEENKINMYFSIIFIHMKRLQVRTEIIIHSTLLIDYHK